MHKTFRKHLFRHRLLDRKEFCYQKKENTSFDLRAVPSLFVWQSLRHRIFEQDVEKHLKNCKLSASAAVLSHWYTVVKNLDVQFETVVPFSKNYNYLLRLRICQEQSFNPMFLLKVCDMPGTRDDHLVLCYRLKINLNISVYLIIILCDAGAIGKRLLLF